MRGRAPEHTYKQAHSITYNGETKTAAEWSRTEGVKICANQIVLRLEKGMTVEEALFSEKKTHNGKPFRKNGKIYERKTKYKY